jgi:hypothetical protein
VLLAMGLPPDLAQMVMAARKTAPFRNFQEIGRLVPNLQLGREQRLSFKTSPFFTIMATGMVKKTGGRQTIKAIVGVELNRKEPWTIYSWFDGYPG